MNRKLFSIGLACFIALFLIPHFVYAQEKITGPWLWMIAPTEPGQGGAASIDIDSLAVASGGAVTEADVAANGAKEGDRVGNYVWTLGQISATGGDNINECLNRIGMTDRNVDDHSSYALFTFESDMPKNVTMRVGSDDAIKVWLNGVVVHNHPVNRGASGFQDEFPVDLVAGDNLLMVKVSERAGGWSMFVGIDTVSIDDGINTVSGVSGDDGQIQDPDIGRPIVQVVYQPLPDSPPRPNVNAEIDVLIKETQLFFADEMERNGFGRKTFQIEVDTSGNTVVHHGQVDIPRNRKSIVVYMEEVDPFTTLSACGFGGASGSEGREGFAHISCWNWRVIAHELGHAFGLWHDFRSGSDIYIMSYGHGLRRQLSQCSATWLDTHRVFNPGKSAANEPTKIEMLPPSLAAPPNTIRLRFRVTDPDGLHQAQLLTPTVTGIASGSLELLSYKGLNGSTNTTVEFVTDLTPNNKSVSLMAIDLHGNFTWNLHKYPINVASLLPQAKVVSIPDANLAAAVRQTLRLSSNQAITTHAMLNLSGLDVRNSSITDLTGLEHAHNLRALNLGTVYIEGEGYINSNTVSNLSVLSELTNLTSLNLDNNNISDISALSGLTNLTSLNLDNNNISDISALLGLTNLTWLWLSSNNISDISALSEMINLTWLYLSNNNISDISALSEMINLTSLSLNSNNISDISVLSGLTNLTWLYLFNNNISDISALSEMTNLTSLSLDNNNISDISALTELTQLETLSLSRNNISDVSPLLALNLTGTQWNSTGLNLWDNPLSYVSINTHIPAMQAKGIEINYTQRTPTKLLKVSGDAQQAVTNSELPLPFVVEVRDQYNRVYAEVPVTFSITKGNGKLSTLTTATDTKGRAKARFTLGQTEGETTIRVAAAKISQPIQFTVKAILPTSFVNLPDTNLSAKITETFGKPTGASITVTDMLTLKSLTANNASISDLTGLQHASNLTTLMLDGNNLSNIDPLTGLTQLTTLSLDNNNLSDITPLVELTQLESLSLENNKLSEVAPLVELTELKTLRLRGNLLSYPSLNTDIPAMQSREVDVVADTRTPTKLINVPGTPGVAGAALQVIVQVQDQAGIAFAGVPVNFTLTAAGGHRSTSKAITNLNGTAIATLTLGPEPGENTVSATVIEIPQSLNFTITTIDANTLVHIPDVNLHAKIAETLNKPKNAKLNAGDLLKLTRLDAPNANIQELTGIEYAYNLRSLNLGTEYIEGEGYVNSNTLSNLSVLSELTNLTSLQLDSNNISDISVLSGLTNLTWLSLNNNNISDISMLSGLTNLTWLWLSSNNISDISALSEMTNLTLLYLHNNNISDVSPLLALNLTGTEWNSTGLYLWNNPLSYTSINTHIPAMQAKGIEVQYNQRTPTRLLKISGDTQQASTNTELPLSFVVEVRDQYNRVYAEVPVTFSIAKGSGKLSTTTAKTDTKGRAQTRLTLGETGGTTTVQVTVPNITQLTQFTATAVPLDLPVSLPDDNLYAKIVETLGKPSGVTLTLADMLRLTSLTANNADISNLTGLQHASNLTTLRLNSNNLSNIEPLKGLTQLTTLSLDNNNLSDITPLVELTQLETLSLENNNLSDVAPLVELTELKTLRLRGNLLRYPSLYTTIPTMRARGVNVAADTRTPTTLINIPGPHGVAGATLQVIVQVQDQAGIAFAGVPVNFTLTAAGGHRSTSKAITNLNGTAIATLTLGPEPGENTVSATVIEIPQSLNFTITTIDANTLVHIPDVNLHAKIAETLNKPKNAKLNAGDLLKLTRLDAPNANIQELTGIEYAYNLRSLNLGTEYIEGEGYVNSNTLSNLSVLSELTNLTSLQLDSNNISDISVLSGLTNLTWLSLNNNNISDISMLSGLTNLTWLWLSSNNISDISALSEMTNLTLLYLHNNNISDVSPLLALNLTGTEWNSTGLYLWNNPLSYTSINTHIPAMQAKGIEVQYNQRTPTRLLKISGDTQQASTNTELPLSFVVEVRDQYNRVYAEVPVTFSIAKGSGKLSTTTAKTDTKGRAQTRLTLGETGGTTTVQVTVPNITQLTQFTATAVPLDLPVSLPDDNLYAKIVETLGKPSGVTLTLADMLRLTSLTANNADISNLTGLQHASNLTTLRLNSNNLSNIEPLKGLTQLTTLSLDNNNLSDITPLVELTQLETLSLENNNLSDVAPLVELTELKTLRLRGNLLRYPSLYTTIPTMRARGVNVAADTRTPTTLINIPGPHGVAGATLQVIVQVQDQKGVAFAGVPVNFTLIAVGGHRSASKAISNLNGKAATTLTLGPEPGDNVVSATVSEIPQPLNFTLTTIDGNILVHIPDVNLHAKIAETLNKPKNAKLKAVDLLELTRLDARNANIQDLTGLEHASKLDWLNLDSNNISDVSALSGLANLTRLYLDDNNISDISALSDSELTNLALLRLGRNNISDISALTELTNLTQLYLFNNNISDISALSTLTNLTLLYLRYNNISDMSPLLALNLTGTQWDSTGLDIRNNPLNNEAIRTHIPAMQARGIVVSFDNITHPEFLIISGDGQEELVGRTLPSPFVVEYRDADAKPKEGVNITFSIVDGDAELTDKTVTTDVEGKAQTFLQLGWKLGIITVRATAEGINSQLTFTAHVVLPENHVSEDVNADGIVDVEDLVLVAATMGTTPPEDTLPNPDVNGDGVVNSDDLALVMIALENTPTAPAAAITAENLQRWIDEAKQLANKDETFLKGIAVLEQLLATLLPQKTALLANYPNPFNPETWIPYHLSKPVEVTVRIYAVNGTLIRLLGLGHKPAGIYEHQTRAAYWDGRNAQGERVASGIYFYTLTAGDFTATRKMLIRK